MAKSNNLTDLLTDVANAIRAKKGTTAKINPQDFSSEIASISTGGGGGGGGGTVSAASKNDVNFYDYDGTLLHSYTKDAFLALSALPDLPTREGLICQEWNYTLADAKEYVTSYGVLDIGATYITDDGKTRLYIKIAAEGRMKVPIFFSQTVANGVTIDWGDGSATETLSGTGTRNTNHTYAAIGDYVITLNVTSGTLGLGRNSSAYCIMGVIGNTGIAYCKMLQKIEIGSGVTSINNYAFQSCGSLSSVAIPSGVTSIGNYAFKECFSLSSVVIPRNVTSFGTYTFQNCYSLVSAVIPSGVTSINDYAFANCSSLSSVVIPINVKNIGSYAFNECFSLSSVVIPRGDTSIATYAFRYCYSLTLLVTPNSVKSIGNNAFQSCSSLVSVVMLSGVTSIGNYAFQSCMGMAYYDFRESTAVPTLSNTNAFSGIPSDCKIIVPDVLYDTWTTATNWSTYASYIIKASELNG